MLKEGIINALSLIKEESTYIALISTSILRVGFQLNRYIIASYYFILFLWLVFILYVNKINQLKRE